MGRVIVIGGGIVGSGVARDLALRGIEVALIERDLPAAGATGRCHGLLHSGARYAVSDPATAAECATEGPIVKRIAPHCVDDTGGLVLAITEQDAAYGDVLSPACRRAGVPVEELRASESPNRDALRCFRTGDAAVDPFLLTLANLYDAHRNGAEIIVGRRASKIGHGSVTLDDGRNIAAEAIVNATGHECGGLLRQSGFVAPAIRPDKGSILVTERKVLGMVASRMRMPSDGDIVVPGHTTSLIGTTSTASSDTAPTREEYRLLMKEAVALLPALKDVRIIRAFAGVRPLVDDAAGMSSGGRVRSMVGDAAGQGSGGRIRPLIDDAAGEGPGGRGLSRGFAISRQDGVVTVVGGKLTTYRLLAERASDAAMKMLGERGACRTKEALLPDVRRPGPGAVECQCESAGQRIIAMDFLKGADISKYNRLGFGTCQGMRCAKFSRSPEAFLQERWKGVLPVLDESQLRQAYLSWAALKTRKGT